MKYLPSKKIITVIIFVIIISGMVVWISKKGKGQEIENISIENTQNSKSIDKISNKDSDGDGLVDWEEALWKTDPKNPDSDGDGTLDGEEILVNRNPLVAGPDDFLEKVLTSEERLSEIGDKESTQTSVVTNELLSEYFYAKDFGVFSKEKSIQIQDNLVESFLTDLNLDKSLSEFSSEDAIVVETNQSNIKKYGNSLATILLKYGEKDSYGDPTEILTEALNKQSVDKANDLKILAQDYMLVVGEILEIPTPKSLLTIHLNLVNNLANTSRNIFVLGNIFVDPLSSLKELSFYLDNALLLSGSAKSLREYMQVNGIFYTPQESGYMLMKI